MNLITTVTQVNTTDFDDNPIVIKQVTSTIGGVDTKVITTNPDTDTDPACITAHEAELTALGFTWSN